MAAPGSCEIDSPSRTQERADDVMSEDEFMSAEELAEDLRIYNILANPSEEEIMITFVNGLERAHQYFEFREYLKKTCDFIKHDSPEPDIFKRLIHRQERKSMFNKLNEALFMAGIKGHIAELKYEMILEQRAKVRNHPSYDLEGRVFFRDMFDDMMVKSRESFLEPLFKIVCEARKGVYFLLEDPKAELDRIMKSHSSFYNAYFIVPRFRVNPYYLERKVKVAFLPDDYTEEDVKTLLLDCGEIEDIELESLSEEKNAYVTFKNSESAKIAPFIVDSDEVSILKVLDDNATGEVEAEDVNVLSSNAGKAKATYAQLYLRYSEPRQPEDTVEKRSKSPGASPPRSPRSDIL